MNQRHNLFWTSRLSCLREEPVFVAEMDPRNREEELIDL